VKVELPRYDAQPRLGIIESEFAKEWAKLGGAASACIPYENHPPVRIEMTSVKCEYCGTRHGAYQEKCHNCGASK